MSNGQIIIENDNEAVIDFGDNKRKMIVRVEDGSVLIESRKEFSLEDAVKIENGEIATATVNRIGKEVTTTIKYSIEGLREIIRTVNVLEREQEKEDITHP